MLCLLVCLPNLESSKGACKRAVPLKDGRARVHASLGRHCDLYRFSKLHFGQYPEMEPDQSKRGL